jgi:hypothetical protein
MNGRGVECVTGRDRVVRPPVALNCLEGALATDKPIAGLLEDLQARGLLEDTLVIWGGEFGRTPAAEGTNGRDHHPYGFSMWLAGGGVRGGMAHGETDEFGWDAVQDRVHVHDLHATILHLLGLDHEKLTYRHAGRDYRLTDVSGIVVKPILASTAVRNLLADECLPGLRSHDPQAGR